MVTALPFYHLHYPTWRYIWWHAQQKMHMILTYVPFYDLHVFRVADLSDELSGSFFYVTAQHRFAVLRYENKMVM
jgi:hypothetical protein